MRQYRAEISVMTALFGIAVVAGLVVARRFGPNQVHSAVERRLSEALGAQVSVGGLRVSPGTFVRVEAYGVTAWSIPGGHGLEIEQVLGSIDALSLLGDQIELARLRLEGAHLRLSALGNGGTFRPVGSTRATLGQARAPLPPHPDELLAPLISLETLVRRVLLAPAAAAVLELHNARISFEDELTHERGALELEYLTGQLVHHQFSGRSEFSVEGQLTEGGRSHGTIKLDGHRAADGSIRISLGVDSVELASGTRYLKELRPHAEISGRLSGQWIYETPEPGTGRLQADLSCLNLVSSVPDTDRSAEVIRSPQINFAGTLEIDPQRATLHDFRVTNRDTSLRVSGEVSRPLSAGSIAMLDLDLENLDLGQARHLISWLPEIEREEAAAVVAPLAGGRLETLQAHGRATLPGWQDLLAGRSRRLPEGFSMQVKLVDMVAHFGVANRLEDLAAELHWVGNRLEIVDATAVLNGRPLPVLDVVIEGFPNFLAGDSRLREMSSQALPLFGLDTLWESLRRSPDSAAASTRTNSETNVGLEIEFLEHPLFLWPLWDVSATIVAESDGVHIESKHAIWAGVPIELKADWRFQPSERISVLVEATAPPTASSVPAHADGWARGRFGVGEILGGRWQQNEAQGHFVATAGQVRIRELDIELAPTGRTRANGLLDLSVRGAVPFRVNFGLVDGDGSAIAKLVGLPKQQIEGRMNLDGSFEGVLQPGTSFFSELSGLLELTAVDGAIRKVTPPVVAIAEAATDLDAYDPSDVVPFDRVESVLEFGGGRLHSAAFSLDGPRIGIVASGELELADPIKTIDAQVYVFLFRKLDRVLGKIPILNRMLLGTDENLVAAAFEVSGAWADPKIEPILLPSSAGSASQVLQGVPHFVMRGIRALGSLVKTSPSKPPTTPASPPEAPAEIAPETHRPQRES
ncbi:MAG: AsmA-like C-terminal domain-containing protein [Myxococcota bacterium]